MSGTFRDEDKRGNSIQLLYPFNLRNRVGSDRMCQSAAREVTLHFALLGVRDLCPLAGFIGYSAVTVEDLRVIVRVPSFDKETNGQPMSPPLMFKSAHVFALRVSLSYYRHTLDAVAY